MPTVFRQDGYRFHFYSHEPNEPPHVHVDKGGASAKLWLGSVAIARNMGYKPHELTAIIGIVRAHRETMLEAWHGHFGSGG